MVSALGCLDGRQHSASGRQSVFVCASVCTSIGEVRPWDGKGGAENLGIHTCICPVINCGNSWRVGGSGPLLSLPQPPEVRLRNQAETTSPGWAVAEPGSKSHLSPYLTVMTSESQGYILNWVWWLIPVIPELGRLVREGFHEFKANETQIKQ